MQASSPLSGCRHGKSSSPKYQKDVKSEEDSEKNKKNHELKTPK
jgi:hypothetical protein